jgi:hypothetical protein
MENVLTQLYYYKQLVPVPEIQELCDLGIKLEKAKRKVQREIKNPPLSSKTFVEMQSLAERMIFKIARILRKAVEDEENVEPVIKSLKSELEFAEFEKRELKEELRDQTNNFPMVSSYILRVERLLNVYLLDILKNVLSIEQRLMLKEFAISTYNLRGITPSPALLKGMKEALKLGKEEEE